MFGSKRNVWLTGLALAFGTAAALADDLETVEKKLVEAFRKHKSVTAKVTMTSRMEMPGMLMEMDGQGTLEMARRDDKSLVRMELKTTMNNKVGEEVTKMEQQTLTVVDGEAAYVLTDMMGQKTAMKSKIDPQMGGDPQALFANLRKDHTLKLLPEETLEGRKMYVIEGTPKEKPEVGPAKQVYYFDQDSGFMAKFVMFNADGKPMTTMAYTDLKFDVSIDPDHFKFKAPPGVQVMEQP